MRSGARRWAIVPAAGQGLRFGSGVPKQYAPLLGRPMLSWTLAALLAEPSLAGIVVAIAPGDSLWAELPESSSTRVRSCEGGARRDVSVCNALRALEGVASDTDWVVVHDAARPCLRSEDLRQLFDDLGDDPVGGLLAVPMRDTLKRVDAQQRGVQTLDRKDLWRALTPQVFRYGLLHRALCLCIERDRAVTDEAAAVESLGLQPRLVRGHADNIKITDPGDAALAAAILASRTQ